MLEGAKKIFDAKRQRRTVHYGTVHYGTVQCSGRGQSARADLPVTEADAPGWAVHHCCAVSLGDGDDVASPAMCLRKISAEDCTASCEEVCHATHLECPVWGPVLCVVNSDSDRLLLVVVQVTVTFGKSHPAKVNESPNISLVNPENVREEIWHRTEGVLGVRYPVLGTFD